ncbi:MAG: hypothetical protein JOZ63_21330, partial [Planctomycetaceae bacterium]|nr:hypothetical protein [Planctomycetaceae bacterium]
ALPISADLATQQSQYDVERHNRPEKAVGALRSETNPVVPFHWEIEFPEVFDRENPGFDSIVGNPPFLGGSLISTRHGDYYKNWLYNNYEQSGDRMDIVAYFFRRAFD